MVIHDRPTDSRGRSTLLCGMNRWLREIGYAMLILWGVVTAVFFLFNLAPGDPVRNLVGENASAETVENIRRKYDLDLSLMHRYGLYLNDLSPLSLYGNTSESRPQYSAEEHGGYALTWGEKVLVVKWPYLKRSFLSDKPVADLLMEAMPGTMLLALVSILFSLLMGIPMGIAATLSKDSITDRILLVLSSLGMAGPSFFVAMLVAWLGAVLWRDEILVGYHWLILLIGAITLHYFKNGFIQQHARLLMGAVFAIPLMQYILGITLPCMHLPGTGLNMTGSLYAVDVWQGEYLCLQNLILPVVTLMVRPLAVIVQLTRSSMLEVMKQDYIRTAKAKGLTTRSIILRHALPNAINPVITAVSGWLASLLAGAVFVEFVFGWKGLGQQMFNAIENRDLPVVMGGVIVIGFVFVTINFCVDRIYQWIDPRIQ